MPSQPPDDYLALDDAALLAQCDVHTYRASGPGGQHRNKVSSAVRLRHRPTAIWAQAQDSRLQQSNRRTALRRLRMNIACQHRRRLDAEPPHLPAVVAECLVSARRGAGGTAARRLAVGRKDTRFWAVAAFVLDALDAHTARLAETAELLGITTGNLVSFLKSDRHLLAATQTLRQTHNQKPLT